MIKGSTDQEHNSPMHAPNNGFRVHEAKTDWSERRKRKKTIIVYNYSFIVGDWNILLLLTKTYNKSIEQIDKNQFKNH